MDDTAALLPGRFQCILHVLHSTGVYKGPHVVGLIQRVTNLDRLVCLDQGVFDCVVDAFMNDQASG